MYNSKHGKAEDKGTRLGESITGNGILPCGTYEAEILSIADGMITIEDSTKGTHAEIVENLPEWLERGDRITVVIGLTDGVYARTHRGKVALFDAHTHSNITGWLGDLRELQRFNKKFKPASPIITEIKKDTKIWKREV